MEFRKATPADLAGIMDVVHQAQAFIAGQGIDQWQDGYPEPELLARDIESGIGCVFEVDGIIAGYMVPLAEPEPVYNALDGEWINRDAPYLTVHRMAIDDGYRGTGLSRQMLAYAEALARDRGMKSVRADTHRGNLAMRGLLAKCGFVYCGEVVYEVSAGDPIRVAYEKLI